MIAEKHATYEALVGARKGCARCPGLTNPSRVQEGALDSEQIGPYSRWHSDLDAKLVVVAKDFAPVEKFVEFGGAPGAGVSTNQRLERYLESIGFQAGTPDAPPGASGLFFTNAILCLPPGDKMRTQSFLQAAATCGRCFLRPLIDLVSPRAVASLGAQATVAVLAAYGETRSFRDIEALPEGHPLSGGPRLFAVPHPVASRPKPDHLASWQRVGRYLSAA